MDRDCETRRVEAEGQVSMDEAEIRRQLHRAAEHRRGLTPDDVHSRLQRRRSMRLVATVLSVAMLAAVGVHVAASRTSPMTPVVRPVASPGVPSLLTGPQTTRDQELGQSLAERQRIDRASVRALTVSDEAPPTVASLSEHGQEVCLHVLTGVGWNGGCKPVDQVASEGWVALRHPGLSGTDGVVAVLVTDAEVPVQLGTRRLMVTRGGAIAVGPTVAERDLLVGGRHVFEASGGTAIELD